MVSFLVFLRRAAVVRRASLPRAGSAPCPAPLLSAASINALYLATPIAARPRLVMRSASAPLSSSRRQNGRAPRAEISWINPSRSSLLPHCGRRRLCGWAQIPRIRISQLGKESAIRKVSRACDPHKDFLLFMPRSTTLSTFSAISPQQEHSAPSIDAFVEKCDGSPLNDAGKAR
jgi:hypothetical protein